MDDRMIHGVDDFVAFLHQFEASGGQYQRCGYTCTSNRLYVSCRNGYGMMRSFLSQARQTHMVRTVLKDGIKIEFTKPETYDRDTLIICDTQFEAVQWSHALHGVEHQLIKNKKDRLDGRIAIVNRNLIDVGMRDTLYYRVISPLRYYVDCFKPMYVYTLTDFPGSLIWAAEDFYKLRQSFVIVEKYIKPTVYYHKYLKAKIETRSGDDDDFYCPICLTTRRHMYRLDTCRHVLCTKCYRFMGSATNCHLCRGEWDHSKLERVGRLVKNRPTVSNLLLQHYPTTPALVFQRGGKNSFTQTLQKLQKGKVKLLMLQSVEWPQQQMPRFVTDRVDQVFFVHHPDDSLDVVKSLVQYLCHSRAMIFHVLHSRKSDLHEWKTLFAS